MWWLKKKQKKKVTPAYAVDHIVPIQIDKSLALVYDNLQSLCALCHNIKTTTHDYTLKRDKAIEANMNLLADYDYIPTGSTKQ